ncbi:MAG TPA: amidase family protein [Methylomirabilota bacterium]|nr:amidase family protein [Methylomirabilota bacterium]
MAISEDLCWMPASEMAPAIKRRKLSPVEVMKAVLGRIERLNPTLNAFVTLTADQAMKEARAAERAVMKKGAALGHLHGVPFSTKDLVITRGVRTTFGTRIYADNVPTEDAPMVARL